MVGSKRPGRWLLKTEPSEYSFEDLVRDRRTRWDGVSNPLALKHLAGVKKGDTILIYHTGSVRAIVGLAQATADAEGTWVWIAPDRALARPVPLSEIKRRSEFRSFDLVRIGRLAVMPVPEALWGKLLEMGA